MKFDLEKAISSWKVQLRKHRGFEDSDIEELEDHFRNRIDEKTFEGLTSEKAFKKIYEEDYGDLLKLAKEYFEQRRAAYSAGLLLNYLKIGWRSISTTKSYFLINIVGLVIGLTSVFYIVLYLNNELGFDQFHERADHIYRVNNLFDRASGKIYYPLVPPAFGPAIKETYSDVENTARMRYAYNVLMQYQHTSFYEDRVFFAEAAYLEMFSFKWLSGNQKNALRDINTIVLTKSMASKYFGDNDPLGKVITYDGEVNLTVTGVVDDVPTNSHISFDFLISFDTFKPGPGSLEPMTSWKWVGFLTYVQLRPDTPVAPLEAKLAGLFSENNNSKVNTGVAIQLQNLKDIYLTSGHLSNPQGGLFKVNEKKNLISLGIIAILLIAISFFNYFNITSALMKTRSKEFGIRKVFGSSTVKVFTQMAMETLVVSGLSTGISWLLIASIISSSLVPLSVGGITIIALVSVAVVVVFTLLSSLLFGGFFSSYSVISLLRGKIAAKRVNNISFGRFVLLLQFGISAALVMVSLIVISQLNFFAKKELGYQSEGVLVSKFRSVEMQEKKQLFTEAMMQYPAVKAVSFGPALDGSTSGSPLRLKEWPEEQVIQTAYFGVDYQFQNVIDLEVLQGRYFSKDIAGDSTHAIMINETLANMLGLADPLNHKVLFAGNEVFEIIGVFKDFHYQSLHHEIGPLALEMWLGSPRNVLIRYESDNMIETLNNIENTWAEVFADNGFPFDYKLLDEQIAAMYSQERDFSILLKIFTSLTIFVAILGLFGLSSINIHQKIKQIAIRRVLGADLKQIAGVVSKKYLLIAILGILVALPVAYKLMIDWLDNYAYSINLNGRFSFITVLIVISITVLTLAIQLYRVMTVNPAKILKDE